MMIYTVLACIFMLITLANSWCYKGTFDDTDKILSIDGNPTDSMVMTCADNGVVTIRNATTLQVLFQYDRPGGSKPKTARWSKNGNFIAIGYTDSQIEVRNGASPFGLITSWTANGLGQIRQLDWNANSNKILACGQTGKYRLMSWTNPTYSNITDVSGLGQIFSCRFGLNEKVVVGTKTDFLYVYDSSQNQNVIQDQGDQVNCVDFSPDATKTICSLKSNLGKLFTIGSGSNTTKVTDGDDMQACSYSRDGSFYAFGGKSDYITMFNASSGSVAYKMIDNAQDIQRAAFSFLSQIFYYGDNNGKVWVYLRNCSAIQSSCAPYQYLNTATSICVNCSTYNAYCAKCNQASCTSCISNYYYSAGNCLSCSSQLKQCITCDSAIKCNSCNVGFFLNSSTSTCSQCKKLIPNCRVCNSTDNTCMQCFQNFYRSATNTSCIQCMTTLPLCIQCSSATQCQQCIQGYYADSSGVCQSCTTNCLVCKNTSYCLECKIGFYPNSHSCTACPAKCIRCDHSGQCVDCIERTYNNAGTCTDCSTLCLSCNASNYCLSCQLGYYANSGVCTKCTTGCIECSSATNCVQCQLGLYLSSGSCTSCSSFDTNCVFCNTTQCKSCELGYYLDGSNTCKLCSSSMFQCALCNSSTACITCFNGYYKTASSGNSSCAPCNQGCSSCQLTDGTKCLSCFPSYYYNSGTKTCIRCPNNCETCSSATTCLSCQNHFYENSGACTQCITQISHCLTCYNTSYCTQCQTGFHLSTNNASCTACPNSCTSCQDALTCTACELGYFLSTGACLKCSMNCSECSVAATCQNCDLGFYLTGANLCSHCSTLGKNCYTCNNTLCLSCPVSYVLSTSAATLNHCLMCSSLMPFCLQCTSQTACTDCFYGYTLSTSGSSCQTCESHLPGCFHCSSSTVCLICSRGFYLTGGNTCAQCIDGCSMCTDSTNCFQCQSGFIIDTSTTPYSCVLCQTLVQNCELCDTLTTCTKCLLGSYYVSSTNCSLCRVAMEGCLYCNDSSTCVLCQEGYYLDTATDSCVLCSTFTGCQYCNSTHCYDCENSFYLDSGTNMCLKCYNILPGCLYCRSPTACLSCITSYYLTSSNTCNLCSSQIQGCTTCSAANLCLSCQGGFYLSTGTNLCIPCSQKGCEVCQESSPTSCLSCDSGYYLNINQCIYCNSILTGCASCSDGSNCDICNAGYYLTVNVMSNTVCSMCSSTIEACTRCSLSTVCLECKAMYFLNGTSSQCELCSKYMAGCVYCRNTTSCLNCQSGFFLNSSSNLCNSCLSIEGCLVCQNQTVCNYCSSQYYLDSSTNQCVKCSDSIPNCFSCGDSQTCTSCQGGYTLNTRGSCEAVTISASTTTKNMKLVTKYVDPNTLKHIVQVQSGDFQQKIIDYSKILISLVKSQTVLKLTVKSLQFRGKKLIVYTDNPLNVSLQAMPLSRLLLLSGSIGDFNWATEMQVDPNTMAQILPSYSLTTDAKFQYSLSEPEFYQSYIESTQTSYYFLYGTIISVLLLLAYLPFSLIIPKFRYAGRIIPQVFLFKLAALTLFPTYLEYINFGYGFMMVDFPWANEALGEVFGYELQLLPQPHLVYYTSLSFLSTYLIAFCLILLLFALSFVILKFFDLYDQRVSFFNFIYNFFIVGLLVASSLSLQGLSINAFNEFSVAVFSFIIGIIIYAVIAIYTVYAVFYEQKSFYKLRIFLKVSLLSIAYLNPLFIVSAALIWSFASKIVEYWFFSDRNVKDKIFVGQQILLDLSFGLLVFLPLYKIILFVTMFMVTTVVLVDIVTNVLVVYMGEKTSNPKKLEISNTQSKEETGVIWDMNFDDDSPSSKKSQGSPIQEQKKNDDIYFKTDFKPLRKKKVSSKTQIQLINPNALDMNQNGQEFDQMHFEGKLYFQE